MGRLQNFLFTFSLAKEIKEGHSKEPPRSLLFSISSLMLSREVMGYPRPRTVSLLIESGDNRHMKLEISGIKIACRRKEKKGDIKATLFPNSSC